MSEQKEILTVVGQIKRVDGRKRFVPRSPKYVLSRLQKLHEGLQVWMTLSEQVSVRSRSQLSYHFVLCGYIAEHCGYSKDEVHDLIMRQRFGEKIIEIAGIKKAVRKSVSDSARFSREQMNQLIDYDLELCSKLDIVVPTAEELGYISNT